MIIYEGVVADWGRSIGLSMSTDGSKNWQRVQGEAVLKHGKEDGWEYQRSVSCLDGRG